MGKKAYIAPRLIPLGKIEEWIKQDVTTNISNNEKDLNGLSYKSQKIDKILLKLDMPRLKNRVRGELEK